MSIFPGFISVWCVLWGEVDVENEKWKVLALAASSEKNLSALQLFYYSACASKATLLHFSLLPEKEENEIGLHFKTILNLSLLHYTSVMADVGTICHNGHKSMQILT